MTPRIVGGIAAAALAVGILTGAAGAIVLQQTTAPAANFAAVMADHMGGASMLGGGSMMGGSMMGGASMMGGGSISPQDHAAHHPSPTPAPTR